MAFEEYVGDATNLSFREYGIEVIQARLDKMLQHSDGVRMGTDTDAVHDMRVASRRLRAALVVFSPAFPSADFQRFEREVKEVTQELGEARDIDVMIETLERLESTLPTGEQAGVDLFVREKKSERSNMQGAVVKSLDRMEKRDLRMRFDRIAQQYSREAPVVDDEMGLLPLEVIGSSTS